MPTEEDGYQGNHLLKKAGVEHEYTPDEIKEYVKCAKDPIYFIKNYVKIVSLDEGLVPFKMYDFQERIVQSVHDNRFVIGKLPRQTGKTTTVVSYFLHYTLFNDNSNCAILANKGQLARDILARYQLAYENLPFFLQQGVIAWNKGSIELENGSKIIAASTSSSAIRGGSFNMLLLDEFAFVPRHIAEEFFASTYPTISSGKTTKMVIISTPCGMNHYYRMWMDANEGRSEYVPVDVHWSEVPGRDEEWKESTIRNTSKEQFAQEFECEFVGSQNTLISATKLKSMPFIDPIRSSGQLDIYREPEEDHIYTITVDVSHGEGLDFSTFAVIDSGQFPYRVVAKYRSSSISPLEYPTVIQNVAKTYNNAWVLVEINDIGSQVANILHEDLEYDNLLYVTTRGRAGQGLGTGFGVGQLQFGLKTSKKVKQIGCANLKNLIEGDRLIVEDFDTICEMTSFIAKGYSYEAEPGHHDDLVMNLVLFAWCTTEPYFKDVTNTDTHKKMVLEKLKREELRKKENEEREMEHLVPFGIIDSGDPDADKYVVARDGSDAWIWAGDDDDVW